MLRFLKCRLGWCGFRAAGDATGCWGQCIECGKRVGFVGAATLDAILDRDIVRHQAQTDEPPLSLSEEEPSA